MGKEVNVRFETNYINNEIKQKGYNKVLETTLRFLDCTRTDKNGNRLINTEHAEYYALLWDFDYIMNKALDNNIFTDEQYKYYKDKYDEVINKNIEFEKTNPIPVYEYKKSKRNTSNTRTYKRKDMFSGEVIEERVDGKKETVKERKAKARENRIKAMNAKSITFAFGSFKPKNNND